MVEFDPGPPSAVAEHLAAVPELSRRTATCSGTTGARSSTAAGWTAPPGCSASPPTPGPTERIAVPHARRRRRPTRAGFPDQARADPQLRPGQRLRLRAAAVDGRQATPMLAEPAAPRLAQRLARHDHRAALQAVVAFGGQAQGAVGLWDARRTSRLRGAAPVEPRPATLVDRLGARRSRAARDRHARPRRRPDRAQLRGQVRRGRLRPDPAARPAVRGARLVRRRRLGPQPGRGTTTASSGPATTCCTPLSGRRHGPALDLNGKGAPARTNTPAVDYRNSHPWGV